MIAHLCGFPKKSGVATRHRRTRVAGHLDASLRGRVMTLTAFADPVGIILATPSDPEERARPAQARKGIEPLACMSAGQGLDLPGVSNGT